MTLTLNSGMTLEKYLTILVCELLTFLRLYKSNLFTKITLNVLA